ncbi:MAG TPA: hypothetical protein VM912_06615 [Terriglobales bacterium]|nr:hypothetical protein [Terriglobales bacterium]
MPVLIFVLIRFVIEIVRAARGERERKPQPVCVGCVFAHAQYAANGRIAISCTFGGGLRPMKLDVVYCTDFRDRTRLVQIAPVGFAGGL